MDTSDNGNEYVVIYSQFLCMRDDGVKFNHIDSTKIKHKEIFFSFFVIAVLLSFMHDENDLKTIS